MEFIFADDARQKKPTRDGMGPLVAIGGVHVPADHVGSLERAISALCIEAGFPPREQFKWSPGKKEPFMKGVLVKEARLQFYAKLLSLAEQHGARAFVVMEDSSRNHAIATSKSAEHDVTTMFLERADWCIGHGKDGVVVIASPGGRETGEVGFLEDCLTTVESGTPYTDLARMPLGVLLAKSRYIRLLQLADIVTSCTVARFAGESIHCRLPVFELLKPLFRRDGGRIGGVGVKLHPDGRYANLYHWLLADSSLSKGTSWWPLPMPDRSYAHSPDAA
jgi:hypothetical protein